MSSIDNVYGAFLDYYGNLQMTRLKTEAGWTTYCCKVSSGLNLNRYIFAIVQDTPNLPTSAYLNDLDWVSFQTRQTEEVFPVPTHTLFQTPEKKAVVKDICNYIERTRDKTEYNTALLPIRISLLHDKKKQNTLQYPDTLFLHQALDTYMCVIELL